MSIRHKISVSAALACTALVLAPAMAAAATTGPPARAATDPPPGYITVSHSGISLPNNKEKSGVVMCPKGTVVLSGGAYIASSSVETGINSSFPNPLNDHVWEAIVNNFSGAATTFNVYAVCAKEPKGYKLISGKDVSNPAGSQTSATVNCPATDVIVGGGIDDEFSSSISIGAPSSYPGTKTSWTAAESNFSTVSDTFVVDAVCAARFPHYAIAAKSASDPGGLQKGIIEHCSGKAVVLGGGNQSSATTRLRIEMKTTQPFPASGAGWKSGENNNTAGGTTLTSYAICAT